MKTTRGGFVEPMLLLATSDLPEGPTWSYELKLDGYRAIAFKTEGRAQLRSRNNKGFGRKYPGVAAALAELPDETVIDGEIVALDESGPAIVHEGDSAARGSLLHQSEQSAVRKFAGVVNEDCRTFTELLLRFFRANLESVANNPNVKQIVFDQISPFSDWQLEISN